MSGLWTINEDDQLELTYHPGQTRAWQSRRRFVVVLAGKQSGKTSWGPWWLWREIYGDGSTPGRGSGDYLAVTASYDLFKLKMLPALRETFEHVLRLGRYWSGDRILELADPTTGQFTAKRADDPMWARIILRSAEAQTGLASATAKGAWLDEAGEPTFTLETWNEVQARVSLNLGRVLLTTTLYTLGWLKEQLYDPWEGAKRQHPEIDVIQFDSTENPAFSPAEAERLRGSMPLWKFNMHYRGLYTRPAGLIYDSFDETACIWPPFEIDPTWQRYLGLDFGGVNTAALFYAEEPGTGRLFLYREYKAGGKTGKEHAQALLEGEPMVPFCVGGSPSEGQWRLEFRRGGLPVHPPDISEVEIGIDRVYGAHKRNEIIVFNTCTGYLDEKRNYRRKLDASGEPTEQIEDKSKFHYMDAERYIIGRVRRGS